MAQLNRASDYGSEGYRFVSCRGHSKKEMCEHLFFVCIWPLTICHDFIGLAFTLNFQHPLLYLTINYNTHQKKRGQSLRLRFPGIGKHPSYFERVMCPRYAQASIFTLAVFFYLAISENKIEKRTLFLYVVCTFICPLAYLF